MKRFNFKKMVENWKVYLALFMMALSVSTITLFTPSNHPANAFLGVGDITIINVQEFAEDLLESFAESLTEGIIKQEVSTSINSTLSQYHIGSYLQYAANLKNQVFAAQAIAGDGVAGQSQLNQYIVRSIISDIDTNPIARVNIDPLYQKEALDVVNIQNTSSITIGSSTQNFLAKGGSFAGNAGGQYFMFADLSQKINAKAQLAAQQDISTASGNKSTFNCTTAAFQTGQSITTQNGESLGDSFTDGSDYGAVNQKASVTDAQLNNQQLNCALQNPGSYVGSVLAGNLQGLFNRAINPPQNHLSAIAGVIGSAFAGIAQQQLIGGSKGGTLISSTFQLGNNGTSGSSGTDGASQSQNNGDTPGQYTTGGGDCGLLCSPTDVNLGGTDPSTGLPVSTLDPNACTPVCPTTGTGSNGTNPPTGASCGIVCDTPPTSIGSTPNCGAIACSVQGTSTSNYGTLYALDSSGNVIAGSGSSISSLVKKKSAITLQWNAADIIGAHYVAFGPCASAQCTGSKDKKDLNGSLSVKAPTGSVQTYTLQVWGVDASGNTTILETDSIAIKTN